MGEISDRRLSRFGDDTEGFLLFYEVEPLEDEEERAARLRMLEREIEEETEGES